MNIGKMWPMAFSQKAQIAMFMQESCDKQCTKVPLIPVMRVAVIRSAAFQ